MFGRALSRRDKKKANTATDPIAAKLGSHVENISANEEGFAVMGRMGKTRIGRKDISPPRETTLRSHQQVPTYGDHVETPPSQSFINPLSSNPIQSPRTPRTPPIIPPETPVQGRGRYMNPIRELPTPKDDQTPDDWPLPSFAQADGKNQPRGRGHFTEAAGPASKQLDMAAIKAPKKRRFGGLFSRKSSSPDPDPRLHTPDSTDYELKKNAAFSEMRTVLARNEAAQNPSSEKVKKEPRLTRKLSRRGPPRKAAVKARVNADRRISRMSRLVEGPTDLSLLEPPSASNSLNVEIPSVELERYSIMFASVLDQKQYPSIASRRASRRSSRSRSRARNIPSPSQIKVIPASHSQVDMTKRYSLCESPSFAQTSSTFLTVDTSSPDDPRPLAPSPTSFRHSTGSPLPLSPLKPRSDSLGVPTHPAPLPLRSVPQLHPRPLIPETPLSAPIPAPAPASTPAPAPTQTQTLTPHRSRSHDALHPRSSSTPSQPPPQPRPLLIFHPGRPTPRIPRLRIRGQDPPPSQPSQPPNANSLPPTAPPPPPPTPPTPPTPPSAVAPAGTKPQAAEAEIGIARQVSVRGQASGVVLLAGKRSVERMVERKAGQAGQARLIELGTPGSLARYYKGRGAGVGTGTETGTGTGTAEGLRVGVAGIEA